MCPAAAPAAFRPCASVAPAASAAAFFAAPASSTPTGSVDVSHTTPARRKTWAIASASDSLLDAATSPAPSCTISRACAGPPTTATRPSPSRSPSRTLGARPSGGTRPLASDTTAAPRGRPASISPAMTSSRPRDGTPRKTKSARPRPASTLSMRSSRGSSTPGRYSAFSRSSCRRRDCSAVRAWSVVRSPPRASRTATAVPNDPAPTTTARRPGVGRYSEGRRGCGIRGT